MSTPLWFSYPLPTGVTGKKILAENDNYWILSHDGQVHKKTSGAWSSTAAPAAIDTLSVASDSSAIGIDSTGQVQFYYGSWTPLGASASAVAIGDFQHYIIANAETVTAYTPSGSRNIQISPTVILTQISATQNLSHVWGVDQTGAIHSLLSNDTWTSVTGPSGVIVSSVHLSLSSSGTLQGYCLDGMGNGYWYDGSSWIPVYNPTYWAYGFSSLQAGPGVTHALMTNGEFYSGTI